MFDINILKFLSHINDSEQAYSRMTKNGFGGEILSEVWREYIINTVKYNKTLLKNSFLSDSCPKVSLGKFHLSEHPSLLDLKSLVNNLTQKDYIEIGLDCREHISLSVITDSESRDNAERFFQNTLLKVTSNFENGYCQWRCIAGKDSGAYLGPLMKMVSSDSVFGDKIFSDEFEISKLLTEIEKIISDNIAMSEGKNIYDYNNESDEKIPITNLVIGDACELSDSTRKKISNLVLKAPKSGINIFIIDEFFETLNYIKSNINIYVASEGNCFECNGSKICSDLDFSSPSRDEIKTLTTHSEKSSLVEDNIDLNTSLFSMKADESIKVPFAIEKSRVCYFELGDKAPHGLISGTTGSGKSVTLHTIIDMITYNYHPDDVEIWAIDYKAVEFGCYVRERTPHFKVIGQDNSTDFSFSLIDMIYDEYSLRKKRCVESGVKNIKEYRARFGSYSMPRILIVIDEFHNLTQAIQNSFDSSYKSKLENLLKEMRAMGMSFLFCSQSIASGLTGLTDAGRDQIKARICMQHISNADITETLSIKSSDTYILDKVKKFDTGQAIYKWNNDDCKELKILYVSDELRSQMIKKANSYLENNFTPKNEVICKNSERYEISEKPDHRINKFLSGKSVVFDEEEIEVFPAAPTTLSPEFCLSFSRNASCNLLLVGNDDSMRESVLFMSVCSLLINPRNNVFINIVNTEDADSKRLKEHFEKFSCRNLHINFGIKAIMAHIESYKHIKSQNQKNEFNVWYGLSKLKGKIHLAFEVDDEPDDVSNSVAPEQELESLLDQLIGHSLIEEKSKPVSEFKTFEDYSATLRNLFEYGPECGLFNIVAYNNPKSFSKDTFLKLTDFDYRIGLAMSVDDSYVVFGTESFTKKANETTAVCYTGSKNPTAIRPYLFPNEEWIKQFNISTM